MKNLKRAYSRDITIYIIQFREKHLQLVPKLSETSKSSLVNLHNQIKISKLSSMQKVFKKRKALIAQFTVLFK